MIALATGTLLAASVPAAQAARPAHRPAGSMIYVPNGFANSVSVIDASSHAVVATVPVGTFPTAALVTPDGAEVFVTDSNSGEVSIISTATNTVTRTVPTDGGPMLLATDRRGAFVYVSDGSGVSVISTATDTVVATIPIDWPVAVAVNHAGTKLYVTEMENDMTVVNLPTDTIDTVIHMGASWNYGLAVSPDDTKVYVASHFSPNAPGALAGIEVIDARSNTVTGEAVLGLYKDPFDMALTPDGTEAYVPESGSGTVAVVNTSTLAVTATISGFSQPRGIAINRAGSTAYVTDAGTNTVSAIDLASNTVTGATGGLSYPQYPGVLSRYQFRGFDRPVHNPPTVNTVRAGQLVKIDFSTP